MFRRRRRYLQVGDIGILQRGIVAGLQRRFERRPRNSASPPIPDILLHRTARRPNRLTHDEARQLAVDFANLPDAARVAPDKARCDEVAAAHFTTVGAMSSWPQFPGSIANALSDVMGKFRTHAQQHAGLIHPRRSDRHRTGRR